MEINKIMELIAEQLNVNVAELTEDTKLNEDLGADSLDLFQIIMAIEEEYNVEIPTEEVEEIHTIGDIVSYLAKRIS